MPKCVICGYKGYKTWAEYNDHHKHKHGVKSSPIPVTDESGVMRLDFTNLFDLPKPFKPIDKAVKQGIVEKKEAELRSFAWEHNKLNPLIGTDNVSSEPMWNENREVI